MRSAPPGVAAGDPRRGRVRPADPRPGLDRDRRQGPRRPLPVRQPRVRAAARPPRRGDRRQARLDRHGRGCGETGRARSAGAWRARQARWRAQDRQVIESRRAMDFEDTVATAAGRRTYISHKFPLLARRASPTRSAASPPTSPTRARRGRAARPPRSPCPRPRARPSSASSCATSRRSSTWTRRSSPSSADPARTRMRTLACWLDGRYLREFEYDARRLALRGKVVGREFRFSPPACNGEFPPGRSSRDRASTATRRCRSSTRAGGRSASSRR